MASIYKQDGARLNIVANGFWGGAYERAFFDVRVFNYSSMASSNRHHESLKKRHYEQQICEV